MLSAIVRLSVRRPGLVLALGLLLLVYGGWRLSMASLDIFPEFSAKRVIVQTEAPGLTPEQVESLVTLQVEKSLSGLIGLQTIRSESLQGLSVVTAVFEENTEIHRDRQQVGERLAGLQGQLPPGLGPPLMVPLSSSSATVLTLGLTSPSHDLMELRTLADWTLVPRLLAVPGVADVNVFGGDIRQLQIQLHPEALRRHGLSLDEVSAAAERATGIRGGGFVENHNQRIGLQLSGLPDTPQTLSQVVLARHQGMNVTLGDVATVANAPRPPIGAASVGGLPAIVMMVIGQYGANTLSVSRRVEAVLEEFRQILGRQDIQLNPHLFRPADYIERSLRNLGGHLLIGGGLVILVLYLFLFDARTAFISALAIPLSLLGAVVVLLGLGVNLNLMVLGGLAIALGEVVDDAIIDTENIFRRLRENRHLSQPRPLSRVVFAASMEVRGSVVYASFIVALSFLPLLTLGGVAGRLFSPLGHAYILAILLSLLTALTVTPALCYLLLARRPMPADQPPLIRAIRPLYENLLRRAANRPGKTLALSTLILAVGLVFAPRLGGNFLPELREGHYIVHTNALPGTSLEESLRMGGELTRQFLQIPGVESVSQWAGRAERGADTYGSHYSEYEVRLKPLDGLGQQTVRERLRGILESFPGLGFELNSFLTERVDETISGYTSPVVVNLYGGDLASADAKAEQVAELMRHIAGADEVQLRSVQDAPLLQIRLLPERLASFGISPLEAANAVQTAYDGRIVGKLYDNNRHFDVALMLAPEHRHQVESVAALPLRTPEGTMITLDRVADIRLIGGRYNILHRGGQRVQTVTCKVSGRDLDSFLAELERRVMSEIVFPPDMHPEFTGASVEQGEARRELIAHSLLAGAGILLLTYIAIGSLRNTWLTLVNLPFSWVGGMIGAIVGGDALSIGSMVGFVTLFGITLRNAIMLISHYRHLVEVEGKDWNLETVMQGARERLPSILMTALVTALALMPIAFGSDNPGREIMGPMAAIIVGGLASSTLLNLLVLPTILWRYGNFTPEKKGRDDRRRRSAPKAGHTIDDWQD
ncbi:MAG: efflux RND transporter permease subunit [Methylococcaceae bacterium]|nr:efflux RND transporter permease subunit [Methylococcaceae bacterium]